MEYYSASKKKESLQRDHMGGPGGRQTKGNKPATEGQILHDLTYTRNIQPSKHRSREKNGDCRGLGVGGDGGLRPMGPGSQLWKMSKFERAAANTVPAVDSTALYT